MIIEIIPPNLDLVSCIECGEVTIRKYPVKIDSPFHQGRIFYLCAKCKG